MVARSAETRWPLNFRGVTYAYIAGEPSHNLYILGIAALNVLNVHALAWTSTS